MRRLLLGRLHTWLGCPASRGCTNAKAKFRGKIQDKEEMVIALKPGRAVLLVSLPVWLAPVPELVEKTLKPLWVKRLMTKCHFSIGVNVALIRAKR